MYLLRNYRGAHSTSVLVHGKVFTLVSRDAAAEAATEAAAAAPAAAASVSV